MSFIHRNKSLGIHVYFIRDPSFLPNERRLMINHHNIKRNSTKISNLANEKSFCSDLLQYLPKNFTLTTNNGSSQFNTELLKDTSSVISKFISENPNNKQYHINIDDKENILGKFEKLYQGEKVVFDEDELPISKKITSILNMKCFPNYMKPESLQSEEASTDRGLGLESGVGISKEYFIQFIMQKCYRTFKIILGQKEYLCNYFGIFSSKILRDLVTKDQTVNQYEYDFDDENGDFQSICDFFNFEYATITANNMDILKEMAEDFKIDLLLPQIEKFINDYEKVSKTIDEQQNTIDSIEELFEWLYNIDKKSVETVKTSILESNWIKTEDDVHELAAYIIQVINSSFNLHSYLLDLIDELDKESKESNKLNVLIPFLSNFLMYSIGNNLPNCSFIYNLYKRGFISKELLYQNLKCACYDYNSTNSRNKQLFELENIKVWFLPELIELKFDDLIQFNNLNMKRPSNIESNISKFIDFYYPDKIELYKKMRDNGEPEDELTKAIRKDDVDKVQSILTRTDINFSEYTIPFNIFENLIENGGTKLINYAAAYGSLRCFKYLMLNYSNIDSITFNYAVFGGNIEIIKIVDQNLESQKQPIYPIPTRFNHLALFQKKNKIHNNSILESDILPSIMKHQNDLFDWILEQRYSNQIIDKCDTLLSCSALNGNAHAFIEVIDRCASSCNYNLLQNAAGNGFYKLAVLICNIMKQKHSSMETIMNRFMEYVNTGGRNYYQFDSWYSRFGNLSIFKLNLSLSKSHEDLATCFYYCIEREYSNIFNFFFDDLIKKKLFTLTKIIACNAIEKALNCTSSYFFNHLIEQIKLINPKIFYRYDPITNLLTIACKTNNIEYVKTIVSILQDNKIEQDITQAFIETIRSENKEITLFLIDTKLKIDKQQIVRKLDVISSLKKEMFFIIIDDINPELREVFLTYSLYPAIENENNDLVDFLLSKNVPYDKALINAAFINNIDIVNTVLKYNDKPSFINKKSINGTALHIATRKNNLEIVKRLLSIKGIDPSIYDEYDMTPLILSIIDFNLDIMNAILDFYGDNIQSQTWQLNKAIEITLSELTNDGMMMYNEMMIPKVHYNEFKFKNMNATKVKIISPQDADQPKANSNKKRNAQLLPIWKRILEIKNIDPNSHDGKHTLLSYACETNEINIVQMLLKTDKIDVNAYAPKIGNTPLMLAILNKNVEIAELLINDQRTNINSRNYVNETAITIAVNKKLDKIVRLIIQNEKFDSDESCLNYAFFISTGSISQMLINIESIDVNYKNTDKSIGLSSVNDINDDESFEEEEEANDDDNNDKVALILNNDYKYETPLTHAVQLKDKEKINLIIQCPSFDKVKSQLIRSIFDSIQIGNLEIFKTLLKLVDNNVNIYDDNDSSLLKVAVSISSSLFVTEILKNETFNSEKSDILNAFKISLLNKDFSLNVSEQIYDFDSKHDHLIDLNKLLPNGHSYFTSLYEIDQVYQRVDFLLNHGADPNLPDEYGVYPLELAILLEDKDFVASLLNSDKIELNKLIPTKNDDLVNQYTSNGIGIFRGLGCIKNDPKMDKKNIFLKKKRVN